MITYDKGKNHVDLHFTHPIEAINWLREQMDNKPVKGRRRDATGSYGWNPATSNWSYNRPYDWNMDTTWESIQKLALAGWQVGTDDICSQISEIKHREGEEFSGYRYDVSGQFFDVGLVISGEPECWFESDYQPTRKIVSLCINIAASEKISSALLARRGAAIISLIERLQEIGYIVDLTIICCAAKEEKSVNIWFEMGTTPLDIDAASLLLAHVGWMRVACFALIDCALGHHQKTYCRDLNVFDRQKYSIYIPSGYIRTENGQGLYDSADAATWVHDQIIKLGGDHES